ncbi:hypothetical protein P5673_003796 [Acropora cervicornis]|uniref:Uncharacterized protein n=1 Tax=Acropora cervicornis TaxID=6130 RepID=A0AAD9R150_ACRCE|nr:hypothetical protein P5673_003796 [Acropora cervicornis]
MVSPSLSLPKDKGVFTTQNEKGFPKPFLFETRRMASLQGQAEVAAEGSEDSSGQYATSSVWFMFVNLQEKDGIKLQIKVKRRWNLTSEVKRSQPEGKRKDNVQKLSALSKLNGPITSLILSNNHDNITMKSIFILDGNHPKAQPTTQNRPSNAFISKSKTEQSPPPMETNSTTGHTKCTNTPSQLKRGYPTVDRPCYQTDSIASGNWNKIYRSSPQDCSATLTYTNHIALM